MLRAYTDGACRVSNPGVTSCAFVVIIEGEGLTRIVHEQGFYLGPELHTNNYAEYMGVIKCLEWAKSQALVSLRIHCDSKLVVSQVNGVWACNKPDLKPLMSKANYLLICGGHELVHIRGHQGIKGNEMADEWCNKILDYEQGVK